MGREKDTRNRLTEVELKERYEMFCRFVQEKTNENEVYTASALVKMFNESLDKLHSDWEFYDDKTVKEYLDKMQRDHYKINKKEAPFGKKTKTEYWCADPYVEKKGGTKEDFLMQAESYIRHGYLSVEDVNTLINDSFCNLDLSVKREIMSYFGFKTKAGFEVKTFIDKVKGKFGMSGAQGDGVPDNIKKIHQVISQANQNDQQIAFHYKKYDKITKAYKIDTYDKGGDRIYRYNAYNIVKFGNRYYTVGRDIDDKHEKRVYRVDLMDNVDLRKNWPNEAEELCKMFRSKSIEKDTWSMIMNIMEMYKGRKYKIKLYVKPYMLKFIVNEFKRKFKMVDKCKDYVILEMAVSINDSFLTFLHCNTYSCLELEIEGVRYKNDKLGRTKLKDKYINQLKQFENVLK